MIINLMTKPHGMDNIKITKAHLYNQGSSHDGLLVAVMKLGSAIIEHFTQTTGHPSASDYSKPNQRSIYKITY
jgi:hypothetical protein